MVKWYKLLLFFSLFLILLPCVFAEDNENSTVMSNVSFYLETDELNEVDYFNDNSKIGTFLYAENVEMYYNDGSKFNVYLYDELNNPLTNQSVIFNINGVNYTRFTNCSGGASLSIHLNAGCYNISTFYNGDGRYLSSGVVNNITIKCTVFGEDVIMYYRNGTSYYSVFLGFDGNPLVNVMVRFNINGVFYDRITNSSGWARLAINLRPGNYVITAMNLVTGEMRGNNITVLPILITKDLIKYYHNDSQFHALVLDSVGNPLVNVMVRFNINGVFYNRTTNHEGIATLRINLLPGHYIITSIYGNFEVGNNITVLSILTGKNIVMNVMDGTKYKVRLVDGQGNWAVNKTIIFNINGVFYNRTTNQFGIAALNINLLLGYYIITAQYDGTKISNTINITSESIPPVSNNFRITPNVGGVYDGSKLDISIIADEFTEIFYSFDNNGWHSNLERVEFTITKGVWDIYYYFDCDSDKKFHKQFVIKGSKSLVWANYGSGVYNKKLTINLTSWDSVFNNSQIFYTLNGSNPKFNGNLYLNPFDINSSTTLKFYCKYDYNQCSDVVTIYYIYNKVGNLNNGKSFNNIQEAIDDVGTVEGDIIEVSEGVYNENIIINKSITLLGNNVIIRNIKCDNAVSINANNVTFLGFNISSSHGIGLSVNGSDCIIANNNIQTYNSFSSLTVSGFKNYIVNNTLFSIIVPFLHYFNQTYGFYLKDCVGCFFKNNSVQAYGGNLVFNSNNTDIMENYLENIGNNSSSFIFHQSFNNVVCNNNLSCGVFLNQSGDNKFHCNWLCNYGNFYMVYINSSNLSNDFYLNYISNEWTNGSLSDKYHGVYVSKGSFVNLSNNWWGEYSVLYYINYFDFRNINVDSTIKFNVYASSYNVKNGQIYGINVTADLTYNSKGEDLSKLGHLPNGIPVKFKFNSTIYHSILSNGLTSKYFELDNNVSKIDVNVGWINEILNINKTASAKIHVSSSAIYNSQALDFCYNLNLNETVKWVSLMYKALGNFTAEVDLIVNGNIVKSFVVENSLSYECALNNISNNLLNAIYTYNDFLYNSLANMKAHFYLYHALTYNYWDFKEIIHYYDNVNVNKVIYYDIVETIFSEYGTSFEDLLLMVVKNCFNLSDYEVNIVKVYHDKFKDVINISIDYPGDISKNFIVNNGNNDFVVNGPGNSIVRSSFISYINGAYVHQDNKTAEYRNITTVNWSKNQIYLSQGYENGHYINSGYDGFLTFTFITNKINNSVLRYWVDEKNKTYSNGNLVYSDGFMKAAYGSFLNGLLVIYGIDLVADAVATLYNVNWTRTTPIAMSVSDSIGTTYLSGESDFRFGMDVYGNSSSVKAFNFAVTSSFSFLEYWVMHALFPSNTTNAVTMGLGKYLLNGGYLEIIFEDDFIIIRERNNNKQLLVLDFKTGIVMDVLQIGYFGSYCYTNQQTEWALELAQYFIDKLESITVFMVGYINNITGDIKEDIFDWVNKTCDAIVEYVDTTLDSIDNEVLGIISSFAFTASIGLFLVSNPIGWATAGAIALVFFGGLLTYYADDLNKGWTTERGFNFFVDIGLSLIPSVGAESRVGKLVLVKEVNKYVSRNEMNHFRKIVYEYGREYGLDNLDFFRFGTLKSIFSTMYGNEIKEIIKNSGKDAFYYIVGKVSSIVNHQIHGGN